MELVEENGRFSVIHDLVQNQLLIQVDWTKCFLEEEKSCSDCAQTARFSEIVGREGVILFAHKRSEYQHFQYFQPRRHSEKVSDLGQEETQRLGFDDPNCHSLLLLCLCWQYGPQEHGLGFHSGDVGLFGSPSILEEDARGKLGHGRP